MEIFGHFRYTLQQDSSSKKWRYIIYEERCVPTRKSAHIYELEGIARLAAIGHITVLEQQKDKGHSVKCP